MKSSVIYILVLIFLGQTFRQPAIFINYQLNKEAIINTFCVNKDKPQMKCNGKCHLAKELQKGEASEKSNGKNTLPEKVELFPGGGFSISYFTPIVEIPAFHKQSATLEQPHQPGLRPPGII